MKFKTSAIPLCLSVTLAFALGCDSSSSAVAADAGAADAPATETSVDSGASDSGTTGLGFKPSNLGSIPLDTADDVTISDANCVVNADAAADPQQVTGVSCVAGKRSRTIVTQADGSKIVVYAMKSLWVKAGAHLTFEGPDAVAFLVTETVKVEGSVDASTTDLFMHTGRAGGAQGKSGNADGGGPGAGKGADLLAKLGGAGAGFCGAGGGGTRGGKAYGNAELVPLVAGSSGGGATGLAGAGGGALQIVAGKSIEIAASGVVQAGGGGGARGAGGGSGGALLLESPSVNVVGTVAANGGGGGGNGLQGASGETGRGSAVAAKGGVDNTPANSGGNGSAAASIAGADGVYVSDPGTGIADHGGGAGGGAGRIRVNTSSGQAQISGTVSPDLTSACATQGKLTL